MFWFKILKLLNQFIFQNVAQLKPHPTSSKTFDSNHMPHSLFDSFAIFSIFQFKIFLIQLAPNHLSQWAIQVNIFFWSHDRSEPFFSGASGSCFWVTHDDEFIVKTVSNKEAHFLQKLLPGYYLNLDQNPRTLLPKFYGLQKFSFTRFIQNFRFLLHQYWRTKYSRLCHE